MSLGLVLFSENQGKVWTHFRSPKSFANYPRHLQPDKTVLRSFENYLKAVPKQKRKNELSAVLADLKHDLANSIQISDPHACTFDNPKTFVSNLFERLVAPPKSDE